MSSLNLKPAIAYRLKGTMQGVGIFMAAITGLSVATVIGMLSFAWGESGMVNGFGLTSVLFAFVLGICIIREDLRLFVQHGVGRTTAFVAELVGIVVSSLVLAIAGTVLTAALQLIAGTGGYILVSDMYQLVYLNDTLGQVMALPDQLMSVLFCFAMLCAAQAAGIFISMGYYHLGKLATVIVSIVVPVALFVWLPIMAGAGSVTPIIDPGLWGSPWFALAVFMGAAIVLALLNWLLIRRVSISPAKA